MGDMPDIAPFNPTKKKKKKKNATAGPMNDYLHSVVKRADGLSYRGDEDEGEGGLVQQFGYSWEESEWDYKYEELLQRLFSSLRENNPELSVDKRRTVLRPPQVVLEGSTQTVLVNLVDLCKTMHRQPEHVMTFMLTQLQTSGSLDRQNRLVVRGRFAPADFEGSLQRYINEYVLCNCCRSPDTILSKENRVVFLQCEMVSPFLSPAGRLTYNNLSHLNLQMCL